MDTLSVTELIDRRQKALALEQRPRPYFGISTIGHPCDRWLWLQFRWAVVQRFPGRMYRLFARGQREEAVMADLLRSIGMDLRRTGDDQAEVSFGWVKGHLDGIIESGVPEAPKTSHVWECKTHNRRSYNELEKDGVRKAKPMHWAQMQCYMLGIGLDRALYTAVCKDDDRIYTERVRLDPEAAEALVNRGKAIAVEPGIPAPVSARPEWYQCKMCPGWDICHGSKCTKQTSCRTCAHFTVLPDERCTCAAYGGIEVPKEAQLKGCRAHVLHPDLVPWALDRGRSTQRTAAYRLPDGKTYLDGEDGFASQDLIRMAEAMK